MSKLETNTIDTVSGTNTLQVGDGNVATINLGKSGDTINVPSGATLNVAGTVGTGLTNTPNFRAKITTDTDFTTGQYNAVVFPSEDYDTASAYDTSTGKFTVPSGQGGKYFIYSQLITNAKASSELEFMTMNLYKNGSNYRSVQCYFVSNPIRRFGLNLVTIENLSAGDYLQMYVYADDASGNPDLYNDSTNPNFFGAYKIIE